MAPLFAMPPKMSNADRSKTPKTVLFQHPENKSPNILQNTETKTSQKCPISKK
jgi:hypothetical protein